MLFNKERRITMTKPEIAGKSSAIVELEPGTHYWCSWKKSQNEPFCDGTHRGL